MGNLGSIATLLILCIQEKHMSMDKSLEFRNLSDPEYQSYKKIPRDYYGQNCSPVITLSSGGKACRVQTSVLGIYKVITDFCLDGLVVWVRTGCLQCQWKVMLVG